jgi:methylthioribose-1-phosphate isomerase
MNICLDNLPRSIELVRAEDGALELVLLDQRLLPREVSYLKTRSWEVVVDAIKNLAVRGAPAIGVAGAAAIALWIASEGAKPKDLAAVADKVANARPTAVNLSWAVKKTCEVATRELEGKDLITEKSIEALFDYVKLLEREDEQTNRAIGAYGASLLKRPSRVLTHCNAGSLATVFFGTALGVIYTAAEQGNILHVYADETRPVGQGARLTSWELARAGVPVTVICDNMAASLMAQGKVDAVFVGADRVARNGDAANKIGTYGVAVLANYHHIPFYVCAPFSTIDPAIEDGSQIPIEQRAACEVMAEPIDGVEVWNPAFDVTPASLITGIVTERGVFAPKGLEAALTR